MWRFQRNIKLGEQGTGNRKWGMGNGEWETGDGERGAESGRWFTDFSPTRHCETLGLSSVMSNPFRSNLLQIFRQKTQMWNVCFKTWGRLLRSFDLLSSHSPMARNDVSFGK